MSSTQAAPRKREAFNPPGQRLVLLPVPLLVDEQCEAIQETQLPRRLILLLPLDGFDHPVKSEGMQFFFHRLL